MAISSNATLTIQSFLNEIKKSKKERIDDGIVVYPDVFEGQYRNELFDHRKAKDLIASKIKDIFSSEWVTIDAGIIKKERMDAFLLKKGSAPVQGFEKSDYLPIIRIHKNSSARKEASMDSGTTQEEPSTLRDTLLPLIPRIIETVQKNLEKNGKVNSKIRIPGIDPDIVFDLNAFRLFAKEIRPVIETIKEALGFETKKEIIGSVDYYIKRDDGGILKIDIVKNRSHDIFNRTFKKRLLKSKDVKEHRQIKKEIQQKRDAFLEYQKNFFGNCETMLMADDFFLGRSKPERKIERIEISSDISGLMDEFPELKQEFFNTFLEKFYIILNSNNITKNDINLDIRYVDNPEGSDTIDIDFKSIENFRIIRGIRKYNGIAANLPLQDEEHEALNAAIKKKNELVEKAEKLHTIKEIPQLKAIVNDLDRLKKLFPLLPVDRYKEITVKIRELEEEKERIDLEERNYASVVSTIDEILGDTSKMEQELFNFSMEEDDGMYEGLRYAERYKAKERSFFIKRITDIVAKTPPTSLSHMKQYDDFDPGKTEACLFGILYKSFIDNAVLEVYDHKQEQLRKSLESSSTLQTNLKKLAGEYYTGYKNSFIEAYANRFFALTAEITSPKSIPPIIAQMIDGTKKYRPIFEIETGHITHRADQVMMRVKEANKRKEEVVVKWREKVQYIENKLLKIEFEDKAYTGAQSLRAESIKKIPADKILDIMVNKDGKFSSEKRLFSWLGIDKIDLILAILARAKENKNMEHKKASINGAIHFFESLKSTNSADLLESKINSHKSLMQKYSQDLEQITLKYEHEAARPMEEYDSDLKKMKQAFLRNFCQPRI